MRTSLTSALVLAVASCFDFAEAISREVLDEWVTKSDILTLDYQTHFQNRENIPPLPLCAQKSLGQNITLLLETNKRLFEGGLRPDELGDDFFTGTVSGSDGSQLGYKSTLSSGQNTTSDMSLVSLTIWPTGLTGRITITDVNGIRQTVHVDKLDGTNQTVLYNEADIIKSKIPPRDNDVMRYADMFPQNEMTDDVDVVNGTQRLMVVEDHIIGEQLASGNLTKRQAPGRRVLRVNKDCKIAIIADSTFVERFGEKTVKQMVAIMADVQEIFVSELGVTLPIGDAFVDRRDNLKLGNNGKGRVGVVSDALKKLSSAIESGQIDLGSDTCITHMFTSRTFGAQLGVAFVGSEQQAVRGGICSGSANTGLSTHIGGSGNALPVSAWVTTVAHEIGHGFGASHDEETACRRSGDIMAAAVRSDVAIDNFSQCSMNKMKSVIEAKSSCFQ